MPIFHDHKTIFVHIPKTAGSSMESIMNLDVNEAKSSLSHGKKWLFGHGGIAKYGSPYQHLTLQQIKQEVGKEIYKDYFKFCFVRNPWDRLVSEFFWAHQHSAGLTSEKKTKVNRFGQKKIYTRAKILDWDSLLRDLESGDVKKYRNRLMPQSDFIKNELGEIEVDFVGKFENITEDWSYVSEMIEIPLSYSHNLFGDGFAGFLVNSGKEKIYIRVDDGDLQEVPPEGEIRGFSIEDLDKKSMSGNFLIKEYSTLEEAANDTPTKKDCINVNCIRKNMKLNIKYYHGLGAKELLVLPDEGYMDEFFNFKFNLAKTDVEHWFEIPDLLIDYNRIFKTKRDHYKEYYNKKTKKIVAKFYEEDIDTFKYTF
jgi:hypothetical protein